MVTRVRRVAWLVALGLLVAGPGCQDDACVSVESYPVYQAALRSIAPQPKMVVVEAQTGFRIPPTSAYYSSLGSPPEYADLLPELPTLARDTYDSLVQRNLQSVTLEDHFSPPPTVVLLSQAELDAILRTPLPDGGTTTDGGTASRFGGWAELYRRYPDAPGVIVLSQPGFSDSCEQAVVYLGLQGAPLAGVGSLLLLEKSKDGWSVVGEANWWIS